MTLCPYPHISPLEPRRLWSIDLDPATHVLTLTGTHSNDRITLTGGEDGVVRARVNSDIRIVSGVGSVVIQAGQGDDVVTVGSTLAMTVDLGKGNDSLTPTGVFTGLLRVDGGSGNDTIHAGDGADTIESGAGDDQVFAGNGRDRVTNSYGADYTDLGTGGGTFVYGIHSFDDIAPQTVVGRGGPHSRYNVEIRRGADTVTLTGGSIIVDDFGTASNKITALARVAATVSGGGHADTITTGDGNDGIFDQGDGSFIIAGGGNDYISTGHGKDTIYGGAGNDYITDSGDQNLMYGGDGNDNIITSDSRDTIYGESGGDTIRSFGGADLIYGGKGNDFIQAGDGVDYIDGGAGSDRAYSGTDDEAFIEIETIVH